MSCEHEALRPHVVLVRERTGEGVRVRMSITCSTCGRAFRMAEDPHVHEGTVLCVMVTPAPAPPVNESLH